MFELTHTTFRLVLIQNLQYNEHQQLSKLTNITKNNINYTIQLDNNNMN